MEKKNRPFLHALKLWLIWNVLADLSLVIFILSLGVLGLAEHWGILPMTSDVFFGDPDYVMVLSILLLILVLGSLIAGLIQWLAFIDRIKHSYWWILATAVGWLVAEILIYLITGYPSSSIGMAFLACGAIVGVVIGLPQWLVLRGKVSERFWWQLWFVLGWACAVYAASVLSHTAMDTVGAFVGLSFMGMITGVVYAYLFSQPSQKRPSYPM